MIPIVEEKESPNPPSAPVVDGGPSYILGPALYPSSGTEEQGDEGMSQGGEDARERTELEGEAAFDDAASTSRTFGAPSVRNSTPIRQYASFDSSLRQVAAQHATQLPSPPRPVKSIRRSSVDLAPPSLAEISPVSQSRQEKSSSPLSPLSVGSPSSTSPLNYRRRNSNPSSPISTSSFGHAEYQPSLSAVAGPSRRHRTASMQTTTTADSTHSNSERSSTPTSSFYARSRRSHISSMRSSLPGGSFGVPEYSQVTPEFERGNPLDRFPVLPDDDIVEDQAPHNVTVDVDHNLRSTPGVLGLGEGWAGGPQNHDKKKNWFKRKSKADGDVDDPLALWNGPKTAEAGEKKGLLKDVWNRSRGKFASTSALVDSRSKSASNATSAKVNGSGGGGGGSRVNLKGLFSRSRVDLVSPEDHFAPVKSADKSKRRTVAFFGLNKSSLALSPVSASESPTTSKTPPRTSRILPLSPKFTRSPTSPAKRYPSSPASTMPYPNPQTYAQTNPTDQYRWRPDLRVETFHEPTLRKLSSMPHSAPPGPGGPRPPWRPLSIVPKTARLSANPSERAVSPSANALGELRTSSPYVTGMPSANHPFISNDQSEKLVETSHVDSHNGTMPNLLSPDTDVQASISSTSLDTPHTRSVAGSGNHSIHTSSSMNFHERDVKADTTLPGTSSEALLDNPVRAPFRSIAFNPPVSEYATAAPGLDTLKAWAEESDTPRERPANSRTSTNNTFKLRSSTPNLLRQIAPTPNSQKRDTQWNGGFMRRLKRVFGPGASETPDGSRSSTPLSARPQSRPGPTRMDSGIAMPGAWPKSGSMPIPSGDRALTTPNDYNYNYLGTQALIEPSLAMPTPTPSRPVPKSRLSSGLKRLSRLIETSENGSENGEMDDDSRLPEESTPTRPSRERRNSLQLLASLSRRKPNQPKRAALDTKSISRPYPVQSTLTGSMSMPALNLTLDLGDGDLGLDDILDSKRRSVFVDLLERDRPLSQWQASMDEIGGADKEDGNAHDFSMDKEQETRIKSEPLARGEPTGLGHRTNPSTSTSNSDQSREEENLVTPAPGRASLSVSTDGDESQPRVIEQRRGSTISVDGFGREDEKDKRRAWRENLPTRRNIGISGIGQGDEVSNRDARIVIGDGDDDETAQRPKMNKHSRKVSWSSPILEAEGFGVNAGLVGGLGFRERDMRGMSFGSERSGLSAISGVSGGTLAEVEEAVELSAVRVMPRREREGSNSLGPAEGLKIGVGKVVAM